MLKTYDYENVAYDLDKLKKAGWFIEIKAFKIFIRAILALAHEIHQTRLNLN